MEKMQKLPQKIRSTTLSLALKTSNTALALQKLSGLTIPKILDAREAWYNVSTDLASKQSWLKELEEGPDGMTKKDAKAHIKIVKEEIEQLEVKLSKTVYLPMIAELRRQNEEELIDTLQLLIIEVAEFYHTSERMTKNQVFETAYLILNQFAGLTIEDVALALHKAKGGEYGIVYNRIDGAVILDWLHKYKDRMQSIGMEREHRKHVQGKGNTYREVRDPLTGTVLKQVEQEIDLKNTKPVKKLKDI